MEQRDKAAYGEQIRQKCHRVEQSSGRAETQATSHPVRWSGSGELGHISTACFAWRDAKVWGARASFPNLVGGLLIWHLAPEMNANVSLALYSQPTSTQDPASFRYRLPRHSSSRLPQQIRVVNGILCVKEDARTEHQGPGAVHDEDLYV